MFLLNAIAVSEATNWLRQAGISQAKLHSGRTDRTPGAIVQVKLDPQSFLSSGKGFLFMENYGRGKLVLFTEDPNFRASYNGLNKLFLNAILLGPSLR